MRWCVEEKTFGSSGSASCILAIVKPCSDRRQPVPRFILQASLRILEYGFLLMIPMTVLGVGICAWVL